MNPASVEKWTNEIASVDLWTQLVKKNGPISEIDTLWTNEIASVQLWTKLV